MAENDMQVQDIEKAKLEEFVQQGKDFKALQKERDELKALVDRYESEKDNKIGKVTAAIEVYRRVKRNVVSLFLSCASVFIIYISTLIHYWVGLGVTAALAATFVWLIFGTMQEKKRLETTYHIDPKAKI